MKIRAQTEIDEQLNAASEGEDQGSRWPGMSYEQGVAAALLWVTGQSDDAPMNDE